MGIKLHPEEVKFLNLFLLTHFGTSLKQLQETKDSRKGELVAARRVVYKYLKLQGNYSLSQIGSIFNQDHVTVLNSIKGFDNIVTTKYPKNLYIIYVQFLNSSVSDNVRLEDIKNIICWLSTDSQYELYKWLGNKLNLK